MNDEILARSAVDIRDAIVAKEISPVEVTDAYIDRIESVNENINAFVTTDHEGAREAARRAEVSVMDGGALGPLHGVPFAVKDLTPTKGMRTTMGSPIFREHVPLEDAIIVERLRDAGGIMLGKTNTPDHGCKSFTDNRLFGVSRNPWDLTRTPGGSSGGSAAAVAAALTAIAEGSDFAGSIRIPASFCGVVGLKPSDGRVPVYPDPMPRHPVSFCSGPIGRTVKDVALMLNIIAGQDSRDPRCVAPVNAPDFVDAVSRAGTMDEWRVGYLADLGFVDLERDVARVCEGTLETLTQYGCSMETVEAHFADIVDAYWLLNSYRRSGVLDQYRDEWTEYMDPSLVWRIERGEAASARDVALAEMAQTTAYHRLRAMFEKYDLLITPTVSVVAPMVAEGDDVTSTSSIAWGGLAGLALTYLFNLSGHPALTIPAGLSPEGLPIGLQLIGGPFDELSVLRFAGLCEQVLDWPRLSPAAILG